MNKKNIFWEFTKQLWGSVVLFGLSEMLLIIVPTLVAFMTGDMVDDLLKLNTQSIYHNMIQFVLVLLAGIMLEPVIKMWGCVTLFRQALESDRYVINNFMKKSYEAVRKKNAGEFQALIEEDLVLYRFVVIYLISLPAVIILYGAYVIYKLVQSSDHVIFSLVVLLAASIPFWRSLLQGEVESKLAEKKQRFLDEQKKLQIMYYESHDFIKVTDLSEMMLQKLRDSFEAYYREYGNRDNRINSLKSIMDFVMEYLPQLLVLIVGCVLIAQGELSLGTMLAAILVLPSCLSWYGFIAEFVTNAKLKKTYENRLEYFFNYEVQTKEKTFDRISLVHASYFYEKEQYILKDFSLEIEKNKKYLITGANGTGKSTLAKILAGLYEAKAGEVKLSGQPSYAGQDSYLFSATLLDNIALGKEVDETKIRELLDLFGLQKYPLNMQIEEEGKNLSVGEKQKINLVRVLCQHADYYIFDEPTNNMDQDSKNSIIQILKKHEKTVIVISHDMELIDELKADWNNLQLT